MAEVDPVILELRAELTRYRNQVVATTTLVDRSLQQQERKFLSLERQVDRSSGLIGKGISRIGVAAAGVGLLALARQGLAFADSAKQIDAQLRLATRQLGDFSAAQQDTQRIADETRNGLQETASLYGNLIRATSTLGGTQADAARATETFSKALKIGGAGTNEAASATLQFGQALASGVLRADEFNSVAEASPRVLQLLADSLGVPTGALRGLAEEGKLTSDVLFRALTDRKFTAGIDEEFKTLPKTFGEAMQAVENAAITTFGAFDRGGEFSTALANFVTDGSEGFGSLADDAERLGADIRNTFEALRDVFDPFIEAARSAFEIISLDSRSISQQIRDDVRGILGAYDAINAFGAKFLGTAPTNAQGNFDQRQADQRRQRFLQPISSDELRIGSTATNPRTAGGGTKDSDAASKKAARAAAAQRKREERAAEQLARAAAQFEQELRQLRSEQLSNELGITTNAEKRFEIQGELDEIERQGRLAAINADKDLTEARRKRLIEETNRVFGIAPDGSILPGQNPRATANQRELVEREQRLATDALRDRQATLATDVDLATNRRERLAIERRILELTEQEERDALAAAIKRGEVLNVREAQTNLERRQGNRREALSRDFQSPLQRLSQRLNDDGENIGDSVEAAVVDKLKSVNDGITEALSDFIGTDDPFIKQLLNILLEQVLLKPIADALSGAGDGGGGFGKVLSSVVGSLFGRASGGYMPPNSVRRVNEGRGGVELLRMGPQGGQVIPLGQTNAVARPNGGVTVIQNFTLDARGGITTPQLLQGVNALIDEKGRGIKADAAEMGAGLAARRQAKTQRYG